MPEGLISLPFKVNSIFFPEKKTNLRPKRGSKLALLELEKISKYFGGLTALQDLSFQVHQKEILGLIGPNGAGKTTLFNVITGVHKPSRGRITFKGESLVGLAPHEVAQKGIARTFQSTILYREMTVLENVLVGSILQMNYGLWSALFKPTNTSNGKRSPGKKPWKSSISWK